jgi:hypothetical protein
MLPIAPSTHVPLIVSYASDQPPHPVMDCYVVRIPLCQETNQYSYARPRLRNTRPGQLASPAVV